MRPFLLVFTFVAVTYGRPEAPVGYNYPSPSANLGGSSLGLGGASLGLGGSSLGLNGLQTSYSASQSLGASGNLGLSSGSLGLSSGSFGLSGNSLGLSGGSLGLSGGSLGLSDNSLGLSGGVQGLGGGVSFGSGASGLSLGAGDLSGGSAGGVQVHKHVYIHVAPEEHEEIRQKHIPIVPAQKNYKIIFIKAPTAPTPTAPVIPVQPQNEEKTLVYVLVKKSEEQPDPIIPTPAPTQPSKPEVYFIKYKAQKEAISGGVGGVGIGGIGGGDAAGISQGTDNLDSIAVDNAVLGGSSLGLARNNGLNGLGGLGLSQSFASSSQSLGPNLSTSLSSGARLSTKYGPPGHN